MTASFQLTGINDQLTMKASFAEVINFAKATGFCPSLNIENCELKIEATGGSD